MHAYTDISMLSRSLLYAKFILIWIACIFNEQLNNILFFFLFSLRHIN